MPHRAIYRRLGLRGEALIILGTIWCLVGVGILIGTSPAEPGLFHTTLPLWLRLALWWVPGVWALWSAVYGHSNRALGALFIAPSVRVLSYLWAWIMSLIPDGPEGTPGGWYSALFHFVMIGWVVLAAHIPAGTTPPLIGSTPPREDG